MNPLILKTDYSLLKSMIKIDDLIKFLKEKNIRVCAITDENLFGAYEFYKACRENEIKPIIGIEIVLDNKQIYLYAQDYSGYQNLLKINTLKQEKELSLVDLDLYSKNVVCIISYNNIDFFDDLNNIYQHLFIAYVSDYEKNNALLLTSNVVYANLVLALEQKDTEYLKYLEMIDNGGTISTYTENKYKDNYLKIDVSNEDKESTERVVNLCDLEMPEGKRYIPHFDESIKDSYGYLVALVKKGLEKRFAKQVDDRYWERAKYELDIINKMGFVDYFLIVYDYVKYAKTNDILVGPGRGSAAGSLVSYALGITNIDPLEYNLLFERFLNPERVTMPDIDLDFEDTKRYLVIDYIKEKYGEDHVALIMTFGTLKSKQVIRDVAKAMEVPAETIDELARMIDAMEPLRTNLNKKNLYEFVNKDKLLKSVYKIALRLENLKRQISTHAAGVVLSSEVLDDVIPIYKNNETTLTGFTMHYLEDIGLLKMDILAIANLTVIKNVVSLINEKVKDSIDINKIPLDDKLTMDLFTKADTIGIFQYESAGMKSFLAKLKPTTFSDLVAAVALFRPGPMENIDEFIKRKEGKKEVTYPDDSLKEILSETYGIIVYQEQIMLILVKMANFTVAEADNVRRAMSKKNKTILEQYKEQFIKQSVDNGYKKEVCENVYELILKFANYGFNKSHAVSYALIGYQMGYLKARYLMYFLANMLNMYIGSEIKTKEFIDLAKASDVKIFKPDINLSKKQYIIGNKALRLPLSIIKNVGEASVNKIVDVSMDGEFTDFFNFVGRCYGDGVNRKTIEALIDADVFSVFDYNHATLYKNLDSAITYAELVHDLDESLVMKPEMEEVPEFSDIEIMQREFAVFGFYVTNHPASKYNDKTIVKMEHIKEYFDKYIKCVVVVNSIRKIKTKRNEDMAFLNCSDETGNGDFVVFPKQSNLLDIIKKDDLITVNGQVERRMDKYQIVVTNIEKIK